MKLWFDEDLSPTLVQVTNALGFEATCNRDRGVLGVGDRDLREQVEAEGYVLITDNASDFRPMYARQSVHHGLVAIPGSEGRETQQLLTREVIELIAHAAKDAGEPPGDFMVNKLVEIDVDGHSRIEDLPEL